MRENENFHFDKQNRPLLTEPSPCPALLAALRLSQPLSEGIHGGGGRVAGGGHHVLLPGQEVDPGGPLLPQHLH